MRLTVNAGLRYDLQRLPSLVNTDSDNISPRLGASWDVRGDGRSVLRAAAGLYYGPIPLRAVANALQRDGVNYRVAQVGPNTPGAPTFPNVFTTFPEGVLTNVTTIDPDIENSSSDRRPCSTSSRSALRWRPRSPTSTCAATTSSCRATSTCRPPPIPRYRTSAGRIPGSRTTASTSRSANPGMTA